MPQTRAEYKVYEAEEAELKLQSNAQNTAPQPNPLPLAPTNNKKRVRKIFGHESKKPRRCSERLNPPAKAASSSSQTLDHDIARFSPEALAAAFDSDASLTDLAELWDSEDDEQAYGSVSNDLPHSPSRQKGCPRACSESPSAAKPLSHRAAYIPRSVAAKKDGRVNCMTSQHLIERDVQYYEPCLDFPDGEPTDGESTYPVVHLEMPGEGAYEPFSLCRPIIHTYDPIDDLIDTIKHIVTYFLTPEQAQEHFNHTPSVISSSAFINSLQGRKNNDLITRLEKAKKSEDGPALMAAAERFNTVMRALKESGQIKQNIERMPGVHEKLWTFISGQAYDRTVASRVKELRKYKSFSDNVYGELLPRFVSNLFQLTKLGPGKTFVDLGSGVANCLVQASLASGCRSYGMEIQTAAAEIGWRQAEEAQKRWLMYGLHGGEVITMKADFIKDPAVAKILQTTDVVLVNNYAFSPATSENLLPLFLELPDGAQIVSLKPLFHPSSRRKLEGVEAILHQGPRRIFGSGSVSWTHQGGEYEITTVDRTRIRSR